MGIVTIVRYLMPAVMAALLAACAATGTEPLEATNAGGGEMVQTAQPEVYRFHPGDELAVSAVNRPELSVTTRVDPYGYINFPYLGLVPVKGLTAPEVVERLTRGLQEGDYYKRVTLTVSFVSSREQFVYVLGEVKKPGPIPINGSITLLDAIGIANGPTHDAEMSTVMWVRGRQSPPGAVKVNLASFGDPKAIDPKIPNLRLIPGDVVYVPDSTLASTQRFFNRMFDIIRPFVALETGIVLWNDVELTLRGDYPRNTNNATTIIVNPLSR